MDSRLYPQGKGSVKSRYVSGVLTFYNTDGEVIYAIDPSASAPALKVQGDSRLDFSSATSAAANTDGFLMKGGTSSAKVSEATAGKFISFYLEGTAASGSIEGIYLRTYASGAGTATLGAARFFATVNNVAIANARGAHISLSFADSGTVSGLGCALETTLHIPNDATQAGTLASLNVAINSDGASSDVAGSQSSFVRIVNQGNATGMGKVDLGSYLFDIQGLTAGAGKILKTGNDVAAAATLKVRVGSTDYFLMLAATEAA